MGYRGVPGRLGVAGAVTGLALWLEPVNSNLGLGQVNALLMVLVVADVALPDRTVFKGAGASASQPPASSCPESLSCTCS